MTRMLPLAVLLVACGPAEDTNNGFTTGGNTTNDDGTCNVVEERQLAIDETIGNPMNFSAENMLGELTDVTNTTNVYVYPDTLSIDLYTEFLYTDGDVFYRVREKDGVLTQDELAACFTAIEVEGTIVFRTGDGAFDETFDVVFQAEERRLAHYVVDVDPASLGGTWTPEDSGLDSAELGTYTLRFSGSIGILGSEGEVFAITADGDKHAVGTWEEPPTAG